MKRNFPPFTTTAVGSFPHPTGQPLSQRLVETLDIPAWPQLSRRTFLENMYIQYSASLPAVQLDRENEEITFDTAGDLLEPLEKFYSHYIGEDLDYFGLTPEYAEGFFALLDSLQTSQGDWIKGQVTGPISVGLTVTDQDLKASLYNEMIADALRRIQEEGGEPNFAVFRADEERNYYIQFVTAKGETELFAEAVSNQYLSSEHALSNEQIARLESMGWSLDDQENSNYYRLWEASSDEERSDVAQEVMRTFTEVYCISPDAPIETKLILE